MKISKQKALELAKAFWDPGADFPDENARLNAQTCANLIIKELKQRGNYPKFWELVNIDISKLTWQEIEK